MTGARKPCILDSAFAFETHALNSGFDACRAQSGGGGGGTGVGGGNGGIVGAFTNAGLGRRWLMRLKIFCICRISYLLL